METAASGTFTLGLTYLSGMVLYSLIGYDWPAQQDNDKIPRVIQHYQTRNRGVYYKITPLFCISLVTGIGTTMWNRQGDLPSMALFVVAVGTAFNNGIHVVNSTKQIVAGTSKDKEQQLLFKVFLGHALDMLGFTLLSIGFWMVL